MITDREKFLMLQAINALRDKIETRRAYVQDVDEWLSSGAVEMFVSNSADAWVDLMEAEKIEYQLEKEKSNQEKQSD